MRKLKQSMAILLGAAMTISLLPSLPATAAEEKMEVVAQYDMSYADGYLTDISGNENHAKLQGITDGDFAEDEGSKVLNLGDKKYVELPAGMIEKEKFEIEAEFKIGADNKENSWLFTLGSKVDKWPNVKNYLFSVQSRQGMAIMPTKEICVRGSRMPITRCCLHRAQKQLRTRTIQ